MRDEKEIFLHACCGPCAEWPVSELVSEDYKITMFYHNPNIHPRFEHQRRLQNLKIVSDLWQIPLLVTDEYREDLWTERAYLESDNDRCHMCYRIRMDKTAEVAKNLGFQFFYGSRSCSRTKIRLNISVSRFPPRISPGSANGTRPRTLSAKVLRMHPIFTRIQF